MRSTSLSVSVLLALAGCQDGSSATTALSGDSTSGSSGAVDETTTSAEESSSTGEPEPEILCDQIEVSLVMDPRARTYADVNRQALVDFFDTLVTFTGAKVRIMFNVGTEANFNTSCLFGSDAAEGPILVYGQDFVVHDEAESALRCLIDDAKEYPMMDGDGDWMFSGLMFPVIEREDWPDPNGIGFAMLLAETDDDLGGMYSRSGFTTEAYLRLVGQDDRRRVAAFAFGQDGDELETFTLSLGDTSFYADYADVELFEALPEWLPTAVHACTYSEFWEPPPEPEGCQHIDILFVIDGSLSMLEEQRALQGYGGEPPVFKDFTDALLAELDTLEDFRVGVISSQPGDTTFHTHRDYPQMPESMATDCGLPMGQRWLVGPSPTLEQDFACIGSTLANTEETTALNAAQSLWEPANDGFLRDDSILFVVMITDEDTQGINVDRAEVRNQILDAVGGDLERIVVLGIAGDQGIFEDPKTTCDGTYGTASPGRRLTSIVYAFQEQGLMQDICEGSLADVFADVLGNVVTTCENYNPPG